MKITLLETLQDELPWLPMLRLFKIQKINHDADDSLKSLQKKMNAHIDFLKSIRPSDQLADQDRQEQA